MLNAVVVNAVRRVGGALLPKLSILLLSRNGINQDVFLLDIKKLFSF